MRAEGPTTRGTRGTRGGVVRPSASAHRVLDARRCLADRGGRRRRGRRRPARGRDHRPREHVRRARAVQGGQERGRQADHRHGGVLHQHVALRAAEAPRARDLSPHVARRDPAGLPQPDQGDEQRVPRRLLLQAPLRLGAARAAPRRHDRHHRLSRRARVAAHPQRRRRGRAQGGGALSGHLRARPLLRRTPGSRPRRGRHRAPAAARHRAPAQRAAARHQRQPLHAPRRCRSARCAVVRADRRVAERDEAAQVRRRRLLHQVGRGDAQRVPRSAGSMRQHAADRRAGRRRARVRSGRAAVLPGPRGFQRRLVSARAHDGRRQGSLRPRRHPARARDRADRVRARRHQVDGVLRILPRRLGPRALREVARASASGRAAGARRVRASRTACASSTSTRSGTTCCSSGS